MLLTLAYHSIGRSRRAEDVWALRVSPLNFESQLNVLNGECESADPGSESLAYLAQSHDLKVLLTFDDGYADNLHEAVPALERYGAAAIVFLASGFIGQPYFWWDALTRAFWSASDGGVSLDSHTFTALWSFVREQAPAQRRHIMHEFLALAPLRGVDSECRPLTKEEVQELARCKCISFGGHTRSHPWLPFLSQEQMLDEIVGGMQDNIALTGREQVAFAYPFGAVNTLAQQAVAEAGFAIAFTTAPPSATSNVLTVPRLTVGDWAEVEFRDGLERYKIGLKDAQQRK